MVLKTVCLLHKICLQISSEGTSRACGRSLTIASMCFLFCTLFTLLSCHIVIQFSIRALLNWLLKEMVITILQWSIGELWTRTHILQSCVTYLRHETRLQNEEIKRKKINIYSKWQKNIQNHVQVYQNFNEPVQTR